MSERVFAGDLGRAERLKMEAITWEEVREAERKIQVGDRIKWRVLGDEPTKMGKYPTKMKRLTVVHKSRHLLMAEDCHGLKYSIRYVELAEARRRGLWVPKK